MRPGNTAMFTITIAFMELLGAEHSIAVQVMRTQHLAFTERKKCLSKVHRPVNKTVRFVFVQTAKGRFHEQIWRCVAYRCKGETADGRR